jgi:hypothetical protein
MAGAHAPRPTPQRAFPWPFPRVGSLSCSTASPTISKRFLDCFRLKIFSMRRYCCHFGSRGVPPANVQAVMSCILEKVLRCVSNSQMDSLPCYI